MITPGNVGVGEPSTITKQIDNVALTNPDLLPVERQAIAFGDPETWSAIAKVTGAAPAPTDMGLVVRPVDGALEDNYNSGLVDLTDTPNPITAVTTRVSTLLVLNDSTQLRHLTIKDGAGGTYITAMPVNAKAVLPLALGRVPFATGMTLNLNTGQTGLRVQVVGRQ